MENTVKIVCIALTTCLLGGDCLDAKSKKINIVGVEVEAKEEIPSLLNHIPWQKINRGKSGSAIFFMETPSYRNLPDNTERDGVEIQKDKTIKVVDGRLNLFDNAFKCFGENLINFQEIKGKYRGEGKWDLQLDNIIFGCKLLGYPVELATEGVDEETGAAISYIPIETVEMWYRSLKK